MEQIKSNDPCEIKLETREDLKTFLKNSPTENTFIKFGATWCRPCQMIAPMIHSLNEQVIKAKKKTYLY